MSVFCVQNFCRICGKCFCCVDCRLKHEEMVHSVYPNCEICVYGRGFLNLTDESLVTHLLSKHLPLHCVLCQTLFIGQQDFLNHIKCSAHFKENCSMVVTSNRNINYESPPIIGTIPKTSKQFVFENDMISLTTSTPMHKSNENEVLENIYDGMTSIEYSEGENKCVSTISKKSSSVFNVDEIQSSESLKKKVTFCKNSIINYEKEESLVQEPANMSSPTSTSLTAISKFVPERPGLWFSMANILKNAVRSLAVSRQHSSKPLPPLIKLCSVTDVTETTTQGIKRTFLESKIWPELTPLPKRIKLTPIQCRKTIRPLSNLQNHKTGVDKSTQTD